MDRRLPESEEDRPCEPRRAGPLLVGERDWAESEEVMSMLPPPTAFRLSRRARRRLSRGVLDCVR